MLNKSNFHAFILIASIGVFTSVPNVSFSIDSCQTITAKLTNLNIYKGSELINSRVNKLYSKLYKECDKLNTFNGQPLPIFNHRRLKCSTDPNNVDFIKKFPDGTIVFRSKMGVDADGSPVSRSSNASPADHRIPR